MLDRIQADLDRLIEENRALKKELARLQAAQEDGADRSTLVGLQRRLESALGQNGAAGGRAQSRSPRRRITDPEVLEKRRAALAKARDVLARKRASGS